MNLFKQLDDVSWGLGSLIVIAIFVAFAISGILIVRKTVNIKELKSHQEVAGYIFANLGVLYSVLLGFTVVNVQQRFDKIKENTQFEASILAQLYKDSKIFSEESGHSIRSAIKNYILIVIKDEWPSMSEGKANPKAQEALNNIWSAYYHTEFDNIKQQLWYAESIGKLNSQMNSRLDRLMGSKESLSHEMWVSLVLGSLLLIAFLWFFCLDHLWAHIVMSAILASVTAFLLFLIYSLDTSFSGAVNIPPSSFERVLESLN